MKYGFIDSDAYKGDAKVGHVYGRVSELARAVALAMPAVDHNGRPAKRTTFKAPGATSLFVAWLLERTSQGLYTNASVGGDWQAFTGLRDNKMNNVHGLARYPDKANPDGLLVTNGVTKALQVWLTDAGVDYLKGVNPELAKAAKGAFSKAAYDKARRDERKALRAAAKAAAGPAEGEGEPVVEGEPGEPAQIEVSQ